MTWPGTGVAGLIDRAVKLLTDPAAQDRQRAAGRALLERHCGPKPTLDAIEAIYAGMSSPKEKT